MLLQLGVVLTRTWLAIAGQQTLQAHQQALLGAWGRLSGTHGEDAGAAQAPDAVPEVLPANLGWHNRLDLEARSSQPAGGRIAICSADCEQASNNKPTGSA